ncbi:MAG: hypothetical protein JXR86_03795 [Spirochaetales bacterium]|nr:hypothetical protein [Spirochaetales bacterium]
MIVPYGEYTLEPLPKKVRSGRYSVQVKISRIVGGERKSLRFSADDGIHYILEIEAAKEAVNLGKNLIDRGLAGF